MKTIVQKKLKYKKIGLSSLIICCLLLSCKKFLMVDPPTNTTSSESVFTEDLTAAATMTDIYTVFIGGHLDGLTPRLGAASDELTLIDQTDIDTYARFFRNELLADKSNDTNNWSATYPSIFQCNAIIEGVTKSKSLSPEVKRQILGEAKFMRAFFFFYLTNLYGPIPLAVTTDYKVNSLLARSPQSEIYQQIKVDLNDAISNLNENYVAADEKTTTIERVRPNKLTANALLARVHLYLGEYAEAENEASKVIVNKTLYDTVSVGNTFLKNSKETIWSVQQTAVGRNTDDARLFILPTTGINGFTPFKLSDVLFQSFEATDKRKLNWTGSVTTTTGITYRYPAKYKVFANNQPVTERLIFFRIAEQYLIRAEARANLNKLSAAKEDLNVIRKRAGLSDNTSATKEILLADIETERRHELFTEWGHRWFDLKRTNRLDAVMSAYAPIKNAVWTADDKLFPIPTSELITAINLRQNPNY